MHNLIITAIIVYSKRVYQYILCWLLTEQEQISQLFLVIDAASEPKRLKMSANSSGNIARQEIEKGTYTKSIPYIYIFDSTKKNPSWHGASYHIYKYITKHISIYGR